MKLSKNEGVGRSRSEIRTELLRRYAERVTSQAEFCRAEGLSVSTLQYWLRGQRASGFIELKRPAASGALVGAGSIEIELLTGIRIKAAEGIDPRWLGQIVGALTCGA